MRAPEHLHSTHFSCDQKPHRRTPNTKMICQRQPLRPYTRAVRAKTIHEILSFSAWVCRCVGANIRASVRAFIDIRPQCKANVDVYTAQHTRETNIFILALNFDFFFVFLRASLVHVQQFISFLLMLRSCMRDARAPVKCINRQIASLSVWLFCTVYKHSGSTIYFIKFIKMKIVKNWFQFVLGCANIGTFDTDRISLMLPSSCTHSAPRSSTNLMHGINVFQLFFCSSFFIFPCPWVELRTHRMSLMGNFVRWKCVTLSQQRR